MDPIPVQSSVSWSIPQKNQENVDLPLVLEIGAAGGTRRGINPKGKLGMSWKKPEFPKKAANPYFPRRGCSLFPEQWEGLDFRGWMILVLPRGLTFPDINSMFISSYPMAGNVLGIAAMDSYNNAGSAGEIWECFLKKIF